MRNTTRPRPPGLYQKCANGRYVFWEKLALIFRPFPADGIAFNFCPKVEKETSISEGQARSFFLSALRAAFFFKLASRDKLNDSKLTFSLARWAKRCHFKAAAKWSFSRTESRPPVLAQWVFDLTTKIATGFVRLATNASVIFLCAFILRGELILSPSTANQSGWRQWHVKLDCFCPWTSIINPLCFAQTDEKDDDYFFNARSNLLRI